MKVILTLFSLLSSLHCYGIDCDTLNRFYKTKYKRDFDLRLGREKFKCPSKKSKAAQAIYDLHQLSFYPDKNGKMPNYYSYVKDRINKIIIIDDDDAIAYNSWGSMHLANAYFKDKAKSRGTRVSTLVHEARHSDFSDSKHVTCAHGPNKGSEGGCDDAFYDSITKGSGYNADVYFIKDVLTRSSHTPLHRKVQHSEMKSYLSNKFNVIPKQFKKVHLGLLNMKVSNKKFSYTHYKVTDSLNVRFAKIKGVHKLTDLVFLVKEGRLVSLFKFEVNGQSVKNGLSHPIARYSKEVVNKIKTTTKLSKANLKEILKKAIDMDLAGYKLKEVIDL